MAYIGYNIKNINDQTDKIVSAYSSITEKVNTEFTSLKNVLQAEWVGPDEQDFEKKLIDRINTMFTHVESLTGYTLDTIYNLGKSWIDFQNSNKLAGDTTHNPFLISSLAPRSVSAIDPIVFSSLSFEENTNFGLTNENSSNTIHSALDEFVTNTKSSINNLFDSVSFDTTFYGTQSGSISQYMDNVSKSLGILVTCVKDFDEAMVQLTTGNYMQANTDVVDALSSEVTKMQENVDTSTTDSRWV